MDGRVIGNISCKILGIFFIIQGTNVLAGMISLVASTPEMGYSLDLVNICFALFYIICGALLWFLSHKISVIMNTGHRYTESKSAIEIGDIQRVAFSVLGLYFIGTSLPKLVSALVNMYLITKAPSSAAMAMLTLGGILTQFIIGIGIFLGSQGLVNFLKAMRSAGIKRENDSEENME